MGGDEAIRLVDTAINADGYIVVQAIAQFRLTGTTGYLFSWLQIDEAAGEYAKFVGDASFEWVGSDGALNTASDYTFANSSPMRVYYKTTGTYTFRVAGNLYSYNSSGGAGDLVSAAILATYHPFSYGSVASSAVDAPPWKPGALGTKSIDVLTGKEGVSYKVDLRELEIAAKDARIKALEAEQTLRSAQQQRIKQPSNDL